MGVILVHFEREPQYLCRRPSPRPSGTRNIGIVTNMIARLGLTSREIQKAVLVAFRAREILVSFKMVLKHRDKEISSLEDIQNLTAKDLKEILRYHAV